MIRTFTHSNVPAVAFMLFVGVDDFNNRSDFRVVERGVIIAMQTFFHSFTRASTQFYRAITKFCSQEILVGWCINMHRFDFCSKRGFQHMTSTTFLDFFTPSPSVRKMCVLFVRKSGVFFYPSALSAQMSYKEAPQKLLKMQAGGSQSGGGCDETWAGSRATQPLSLLFMNDGRRRKRTELV